MIVNKLKKAAKQQPFSETNQTLLNEQITDANINKFLFNANSEPEQENVLINIQGKNILSNKNVCVISGKPKSRKSVVAHSIIGAAISERAILGIECNLGDNNKVVLIDTEQNHNDLYRSITRMKQLCNLQELPANLLIYSVRQLDPPKIKILIKLICSDTTVKLVIIDGALDLIFNMNDVIEVKETIDWIKLMLTDYDIGFVFILHQSKTTNFTIGHLGSFMDRFAQTVLEVIKKDNGNSEIKSQMMRSDSDFESYEIFWNHNTNNYDVDWMSNNDFKVNDVKHYTINENIERLKKLFVNAENGYTYKDLTKKVAIEYKKSEAFSKKLIKDFFDTDIIYKNDKVILMKSY